MTSTPFTSGARSTDGHPDVAEISALNEDLLPADRSSALHAHLADCRLCADVLVSLEGIRETLGAMPNAAPMPEDIAGRIDAALATEGLGASSGRDPSTVSRETGAASAVSSVQSDPYSRSVRETASEASHRHTAGAVSRETSIARRAADRPAGRPGGGSSGPGRHRPARRARRWRSAVLAGAGAVVALALGGIVIQSMGDSAPSTAGGPKGGHTAAAGSALEKHVHGLLAEHESGESTGGAGGTPSSDFKTKESPENSPLAGGANSMPSCVRAGIDRTEKPLAMDEHAPYKGRTAFLVVMPHESDPKRVDAYVVDSSCVEGGNGGPGTLLAKHTYSRR
ncbi:hypothetical protein [Streptomyces marispadix]|uniref:Zinc-finger domain-containing protein n=1 Tax=Streptomyces marispadix TaxID=2922868 RepID=A0ABS9SZI4_9ACTN|nr:hypothetical protein [Streptomyces marispadix]MCH6161451.1 hypothetical protein [Streptomyces marispadix]